MTSLQALVEKAKGGSGEAFGEVVERCSPRLHALMRGQLDAKLRQKVGVEDLVQETFFEAWRRIPDFRWQSEEAFWSWLATLAQSVIALEARRLGRKKRDVRRERSLNQRIDTAGGGLKEFVHLLKASGSSPSKIIRRDERLERLKEAIQTLSPEYRNVIFLTRVREMPIKEVAERMGRSRDAVSMLLLRALGKLKDAFGPTDSVHLPREGLKEEDFGL